MSVTILSSQRQVLILTLVVALCAGGNPVAAQLNENNDLLTLGSRAPLFDADEFVQGARLDVLSPGTVYAIEFSGTQCAPCIQAIPLMNELQQRYDEVIFMSVFTEGAETVRKFLQGPGRNMTGRVIADADGSIWNAWSMAAGQTAIPHVFVVDAVNRIAWIGHPDELPNSLIRVVAGEHDYQVDSVKRMLAEINKRAALKRRRLAERDNESQRVNNEQVTALIQERKYEEAVALLDDLMTTYGDLPIVDGLRARKLLLLGRIEGRRDEAYDLALDIIVDAQLNGVGSAVGTCHSLLNHYEFADVEKRDERVLDLVFASLSDLRSSELSDIIRQHTVTARAHHLRGDHDDAERHIKRAIQLQETLVQQMGAEKQLARLRKTLSTYEESKTPIEGDRE